MTLNSHNLSKEQVLIVGCGDIGVRFANVVPNNYKVTGLRRHPPANTQRLHYKTCDVTDPNQLDNVFKDSEFNVILITMTPSERTDSGYENAYVQTCKNLIVSLKKYRRKPRLVIFVSSTGVYGQSNGEWVDENSPTEPDSFTGKRLLQAEKIMMDSDLGCTIVRFSGIYGPGRTRLIEQVLQGRADLSSQITNRIHVDDCAAVLLHLVELHCQGTQLDSIYIATDNAPVAMATVMIWLAQQLGMSYAAPMEEAETENNIKENINKYCSNHRLLATGFHLRYPTYREGYAAILATNR